MTGAARLLAYAALVAALAFAVVITARAGNLDSFGGAVATGEAVASR